jgi:hypothetical protein
MVSAEFSALGQADFCDATDPGVSREDIEDHLQEQWRFTRASACHRPLTELAEIGFTDSPCDSPDR